MDKVKQKSLIERAREKMLLEEIKIKPDLPEERKEIKEVKETREPTEQKETKERKELKEVKETKEAVSQIFDFLLLEFGFCIAVKRTVLYILVYKSISYIRWCQYINQYCGKLPNLNTRLNLKLLNMWFSEKWHFLFYLAFWNYLECWTSGRDMCI